MAAVPDVGRQLPAAHRGVPRSRNTTGLGPRLSRTFLDAGLAAPTVECQGPVAAGEGAPLFPWLAYSLRVLEPALAKAGLSLPPGLVSDDTLPDQLEKAVLEQGSQVLGALQYGAWTRVP